jgi:NAD-dependent deacetylase
LSLEADIRSLASRLDSAARLTVLTGAGVSAGSGIPTFRGVDGLWKSFRAEELATPEAFARDPKTVWEWYDWRRQKIARAAPNRAHEVLAAWSRRFAGFALVTQNVDGLHERAGTQNVIRFHGSIWELFCWDGCGRKPWRDDRAPLGQLPARCPECAGLARPGVVWFGEPIDPDVLARSRQALDCEICLVVGTSSIVYPAAALAAQASSRGAFVVEINPEPGAEDVDLAIAGKAEEVLDRVESLIGRESR